MADDEDNEADVEEEAEDEEEEDVSDCCCCCCILLLSFFFSDFRMPAHRPHPCFTTALTSLRVDVCMMVRCDGMHDLIHGREGEREGGREWGELMSQGERI